MTYTDTNEDTCTVDCDYGSLVWYIREICGGMDLHEFDEHEKAQQFGYSVRKNCPDLDVEINLLTVRLRLK